MVSSKIIFSAPTGIVQPSIVYFVDFPAFFGALHNKTILFKIAVKIRWFIDETLCHISSVRVSHIVGNSTIIGQQLDSSFISTFHGKYNGTASMQTVEKRWIMLTMKTVTALSQHF